MVLHPSQPIEIGGWNPQRQLQACTIWHRDAEHRWHPQTYLRKADGNSHLHRDAEERRVCVRHILKAKLHFSTHAVPAHPLRRHPVNASMPDGGPVHAGTWCVRLTICAP